MSDSVTNPLLRRTVRNSVFLSAGTIINFVLAFAFGGLTIRFLGNSRAGYFLTLQAIIALNALVGGFGLGTPAVRRVAALYAQSNWKPARQVVGSVLTINAVIGLVFAVAIVALFPLVFVWSKLDGLYQTDAFGATILVALSFFVGQVSGAWRIVYDATQRYDISTVLNFASGLSYGVLGILILTLAPSMTAIACASLVVNVGRVALDAFFASKILKQLPTPTWDAGEIRPMLKFGGWAYLASIGSFLFTDVDALILTTFLGSAAMPYYAVPQSLYNQVHAALVNQSQFLFPMIAGSGDNAATQAERVEDRMRWVIALASGVIYFGLAVLGPFILSKLVSPDFARLAMLPLIVVCIQGFIHAQMIVPYFSSWGMGAGAPNTVAQIANGLLVILTAIFLIPHLGYLGMSLAQLWIGPVTLVHTLWVRRLVNSRSHPWHWLRAYISPAIMLTILLLTVVLGRVLTSGDSLPFFAIMSVGGAAGLAAVWMIEVVFFPSYHRWQTLIRAIEIPLARFKKVRIAS